MFSRSALLVTAVQPLVCALSLAVMGCAQIGDAWQKAGREAAAFFDPPSAGPTGAEQKRAEQAYDRALKARQAGDPATAAKHLRDAAEGGHAEAAYELGLAYMEGNGVPQNYDLSATWINRAADLGDPGAQFLVGSSFYAGIGVEQDIPRGLSFLELAADQGHAKAQLILGQAYVDGIGVPENAEWAARWYGKAARGGEPQAQFALGVMFASGLGIPRNTRRAYQWLSIAAGNGYQKAAALRDGMASRLSPAEREKADAHVARFAARATGGYADPPTVMYVQLRLSALGFDVGPVDGIAGPKTRAAIEAFQASQRLTVDGKASRGLVENLLTHDVPGGI